MVSLTGQLNWKFSKSLFLKFTLWKTPKYQILGHQTGWPSFTMPIDLSLVINMITTHVRSILWRFFCKIPFKSVHNVYSILSSPFTFFVTFCCCLPEWLYNFTQFNANSQINISVKRNRSEFSDKVFLSAMPEDTFNEATNHVPRK